MSVIGKIKNWWSYQPESTNSLKQPLDGGNNYIIQREFAARLDNMYSSIDLSNSDLEGKVYDEYFLMLFQKNYFCNLFDIETDDNDFRKCWNIFVELCFWFGEAAIVNKGIKGVEDTTELVPVYIRQKTHNPLGYINKDFTYYFGAPIIPMMGDSKFNKDNPSGWGLKDMKNNDEFVYGKWNTQGYGAWVWMYKFIKFQRDLMFLTHNSAYLQKEMLFYKVNNLEASDVEIRHLYNPKTNIITTMGIDWENGGKMENRWMVETPSDSKSMLINDVYDWHMQKYYELFGRKMNIDDKKERNISIEVNASQQQFDVIINETKKYMDIALKECKEKFGKKGEFINDIKKDMEENKNKDIINYPGTGGSNGHRTE